MPSANSAAELFRLTVTDNPFLKGKSVSPPQFTFLTYPGKEVLYGGSAGGGKSVALLMAALQYVMTPGYAALLLRRTFPDLNQPKALIPLSHEFLQGTGAYYNDQKHRWNFPNGSTLSFGYLQTENDKYQYQGAAFHFVGFDELTQFTETQYTYLASRIRRTANCFIPLRLRGATNPGGVGHQWVRDRFINPKTRKPGRLFIPARLEDNPWLDAAEYELSLSVLDHITRRQLRHGDWDIRPEGNAFRSEWFKYYEVDDTGDFYRLPNGKPVAKSDCTRFASSDIAGTEAQDHTDPDYTAIQVWDVSSRGEMFLVNQWRGRFEIPDVEEKLMNLVWRYEVQWTAIEKNGIGLPLYQEVKKRGLNLKGVNVKRDKFARSQSAQVRMEAGMVYMPKSAEWLEDFEAELLSFPMVGVHDDQVDAFSLAAQMCGRLFETNEDGDNIHAAQLDKADAQQSAQDALEQKRAEVVAAYQGDDLDDVGWHEIEVG